MAAIQAILAMCGMRRRMEVFLTTAKVRDRVKDGTVSHVRDFDMTVLDLKRSMMALCVRCGSLTRFTSSTESTP
jgi:hypothetical protein